MPGPRSIHVAALLALGLATQCATAADTVLRHGHVWTGNPKQPWAEAVHVREGRIAAIGSDTEIASAAAPGAEVIDLRGRTVIPGFVDSHAHVLFGAYALHGMNLTTPERSITTRQPEELVAKLKEYAAAHRDEPVLFARADFSAAPPYTPTRELLDKAIADRPLVVHNSSEHALWVNSAALTMAGITDRPVPDAAEERGIVRDASGRASGTIIEAGMEVVERAVAARVPRAQKLAMLREASRHLNRYGITTVVNATGNLDEIGLFAELHEQNALTVRTRTAFGAVAVPHRMTPQLLDDLETARKRYNDDWVSANLVKFFADGFSGIIPPLVYDAHEYAELVAEVDRRGFQVMTHAARSDSVHMILNTYERVVARNGPRDRRLRIEHADITADADLPRFARLGVIVVMEPLFCCSGSGLISDREHPVPNERWRTLLAEGTLLGFASDWPCSWPPDPFLAIQQAVTRDAWRSEDTEWIVGNPFDGAGQGGAKRTGKNYFPEETISVEQAVRAYTAVSAHASFFDDRLGTLETGKLADLVVLSQDIFAVPHAAIGATQVELTMVGGKIVYQRKP